MPIRRNGLPWKEDGPGVQARNEALRAIKRLGRAIWEKWSGYHRGSLVETKMHCFKPLGQRVMARTFDRQMAELKVRTVTLNCFLQIGTPNTVRISQESHIKAASDQSEVMRQSRLNSSHHLFGGVFHQCYELAIRTPTIDIDASLPAKKSMNFCCRAAVCSHQHDFHIEIGGVTFRSFLIC